MGLIRSVHDIVDRVDRERVDTPEWGDGAYVYVRGLTVQEYERWQRSLMSQKAGENPRVVMERMRGSNARLAILGSCDENGEPLFSEADIPFLMEKSHRALNRVVSKIQKLSGIGQEDEVINEFEGNSEAERIPSSSSS
jgi:hypothetical protein